jgi:transcription initiation factor TFIIIB Brf1 subunit/transcription initiation factor TFIIB
MVAAIQETKSAQSLGAANEPKFGRVLLNISNSVLPMEKLTTTPSSLDGMAQEVETDLRNLACHLIQTAGKLLKLPQVAVATACVLFHRFFYRKSFVRYNMEQAAMGCVSLACKIAECPRRPRDVINVFHHIKQVREGKLLQPMILDGEYMALENSVIKAERRVLIELGFCVHTKLPYKLMVAYLQMLGFESHHRFVQMSWNFMNDSLRTDCFVRYQPETIAWACIYLSAQKLNIPLPQKVAWYRLLDVAEDDVRDCCYRIVSLYQMTRVRQEDLEKIVGQL